MFSIILAYKPDGGIRDRHLEWTVERYNIMFPDAEIVVSEDNPDAYGWDTFSKAKYINLGVKKAAHDILFITDIDMIHDKEAICTAIHLCSNYSFVVPASKVYKLSRGTTDNVLSEKPTNDLPKVKLELQKEYFRRGKDVNGWMVITRQSFLTAGGFDENFVGWGSEDSAFYCACQIMNKKPMTRVPSKAFHMWHKELKGRHQKRDKGYAGSVIEKYEMAQYDKEMMEKLIRERSWKH